MNFDTQFAIQLSREIQLGCQLWEAAHVFGDGPGSFLLDSAIPGQGFTFLGGRPVARITGYLPASTEPGNELDLDLEFRTLTGPGDVLRFQADPFQALRDLQARYADVETAPEARGIPFTGGLVGVFGYEAGQAVEVLPRGASDDLGLPVLAFQVADTVVVQDHAADRILVFVTGRGSDRDRARNDAQRGLDRTCSALEAYRPEVHRSRTAPKELPEARPVFSREAYLDAVEACRQRILAGDVFEVCLTNRLEVDPAGDPWHLYQVSRMRNPAPFSAWLDFPGFQLVGASPERFLKLDTQGRAESRPIKGTRPRSQDPLQDKRLRRELAESEKDRAENVMIVDLVRNDLGRVARTGTVRVPELLAVETFATVFQMVSTVTAELRPGLDGLDLVRACFPGGSMTGAPKVKAMEIIDSVEGTRRGIYSGAVGYLDRSGAMDLGMVIRTVICQPDRWTIGTGGAVTADSDPEAEYLETMDKARALLEAIAVVGKLK